jgi:hypothetical protein
LFLETSSRCGGQKATGRKKGALISSKDLLLGKKQALLRKAQTRTKAKRKKDNMRIYCGIELGVTEKKKTY